MAKRKIGLMGGTFDPVHNAHLALARQAYRQFSLDEVWMLPNGNPPHKRDHSKADVNMRLDMLRLAVKGLSYVKVCDLEQSEDAYHYTFQTLLTECIRRYSFILSWGQIPCLILKTGENLESSVRNVSFWRLPEIIAGWKRFSSRSEC